MAKTQKRTAKERRAALKNRTKENVKNKNSGGGKGIIDTSKHDAQWFKPKDKTRYAIDIVPYLVTDEQLPITLENGYEDYLLDVWVHYNIGPNEDKVICLAKSFSKPCPICDERKQIEQDGGSDKEIKELTPSRRVIYNIIDLDDEDKGVQLFDVSHFLFEKEVLEEAETAEEEVIIFSDREEGRTIKFRAKQEKKGGFDFITFKSINFKEREAYDEDILDEVYPLDKMLIVPTYDEVRNLFLSLDDEQKEEEIKEPKSKPKRKRKEKEKDVDKEDKTIDKEDIDCPFGHKYGVDCDETDDCEKCDEWDDCADEQEKIEQEKK